MKTRISTSIEVNEALFAELIQYLEAQAAGQSGDDRRYVESVIDDCRAGHLSKDVKYSLEEFLMFRAGFGGFSGGIWGDWSK